MHGPQMLPGGETVLYTFAAGNSGNTSATWDNAQVVAYSLKTGTRRTLVQGAMEGRYLPTGHIAYAVRGVLFAVPFDLRRLEVTGGPVPLVEGVRTDTSTVHYSVSGTGSLVYLPGPFSGASGHQDLAFVEPAKGTVEPLKLPIGQYETPRVSPNGKRVAFGVDDGREQMVWIYELAGATAMRRLTFGGKNRSPVWSADSDRVAFSSDREGDTAIFWQRADGSGTAERLTKPEQGASHVPESWSPDGKTLLFSTVKGPNQSLWMLSLQDKKTSPFDGVQSINPIDATFSPDGRWVAYQSYETGNGQIFVQPFPSTGTKYQITKTTGNCHHPLWSRDGKNLFYIPGRREFAVVSVTTTPSFAFSNPTSLPRGVFAEGGPDTIRNFDDTRDGRLVAVVPAGPTEAETSRAADPGSAQLVRRDQTARAGQVDGRNRDNVRRSTFDMLRSWPTVLRCSRLRRAWNDERRTTNAERGISGF